MYNVLTLNKISPNGTSRLGADYNVGDAVENPTAVLVRSASMHDMEMPESLLAIARCGAGTNNIPKDVCADKGIVVFNTPGANANAVKELVLAGLFLSSRKVVEGIEWAKTLKGNGDAVGKMAEKGKGQFVGPEILGKTLGVVGLGAIGILVANAAVALGMKVIGYDPFLSVNNALKLDPSIKVYPTVDDVITQSDYVTIHVPLLPDTKDMIDAEAIAKMKDGVRILNYSRDGLVNAQAVLDGIKSGKVAKYVTDFSTDEVLAEDGVICMPHLGASTPESEDNCAVMGADQIKEYLENGNIVNSVNYPNVTMGRSGAVRYCVLFKGDSVKDITAAVSGLKAVEAKTRGDYGYAIIDADDDASVSAVEAVEGVIRVRIIK
ncbi:MAG: 3-phosphoglycerate dehydrogenase family protein [Ruminococcus sp.]|nr:3-phosphoglycerate dehydrogenase family protein [Ruminococcus sp.]